MNFIKYVVLLCIVASPSLLVAAEKGEHRYTPREQIEFKQITLLAFDHSGKMVTRRQQADGSSLAEHNGSLANVTVARLGADGKVEAYCTSDAEAAKTFMAGESEVITNPENLVPVAKK